MLWVRDIYIPSGSIGLNGCSEISLCRLKFVTTRILRQCHILKMLGTKVCDKNVKKQSVIIAALYNFSSQQFIADRTVLLKDRTVLFNSWKMF